MIDVGDNHYLGVLLDSALEQFNRGVGDTVNHRQVITYLAVGSDDKHGAHVSHLVNRDNNLR